MNAKEAWAGLAAEVLAAQWWLEERRHVDAGLSLKTVEVCQSDGSS